MFKCRLTVFLSLLFTAFLGLATAYGEGPDAPKGVVLIVIDDIGYGDIDILHPSDELETPNLDSLYKQSLRLTDFHVGTTCSPSRASFMTGRSVNAGGVWHTIAGREILRENEQTVAEVFKSNGWTTGVFGKWHLGEGFPFAPRFRGFDVSIIHGGGGVGQGPDYWENDYYSGVDFEGNDTRADYYFDRGVPFKADKFCTDLWFDRAQKFIKQSVENDKPFFCYIPTNAAHGPFNAPHGYKKGFDGLIENVDHNVGEFDKFLASQGIKDDVLVIFTTDNGTAGKRFGGLRGKKGSHFDGGHNVPCFVRWKNGGMAGEASSSRDIVSLTAAMDWMPTFIDLFGFTRPEGGKQLHGLSLKDMLLDPGYQAKPRTLCVDTQRGADLVKWKKACIMHDDVVDGKIKHKWRLTRDNDSKPFELFDFQADRDTNTVVDGQEDLIGNLSKQYDQWWDEIATDWKPYPAFVLNDDKEEELTLHAHSWIGNGGTPWHQNHVKKGTKGSGIHSVRFDKPGTYQFELRRWPREDGGSITGPSKTGGGQKIAAKTARISVDGAGKAIADIPPEASFVTLELEISNGQATTLETEFLDENDKRIVGAYYVYIKRIK